jgi:adenosine deaminase
MTVHAGEASGAQSVRDAVEIIGVPRVGHGVRSREDPELLPILRRHRTTLEMCPTSNFQTKSVPDPARHPLGNYYRSGIQVTVNTDNRTVSDTTMTQELILTHQNLHLTVDELADMTLTAVRAGFADTRERLALADQYWHEMTDLGISLPNNPV